jgi:hypothetical protein
VSALERRELSGPQRLVTEGRNLRRTDGWLSGAKLPAQLGLTGGFRMTSRSGAGGTLARWQMRIG